MTRLSRKPVPWRRNGSAGAPFPSICRSRSRLAPRRSGSMTTCWIVCWRSIARCGTGTIPLPRGSRRCWLFQASWKGWRRKTATPSANAAASRCWTRSRPLSTVLPRPGARKASGWKPSSSVNWTKSTHSPQLPRRPPPPSPSGYVAGSATRSRRSSTRTPRSPRTVSRRRWPISRRGRISARKSTGWSATLHRPGNC